jgi:hypothetical protein
MGRKRASNKSAITTCIFLRKAHQRLITIGKECYISNYKKAKQILEDPTPNYEAPSRKKNYEAP